MAKYFIGDRVIFVSQWNDKTNQNSEGKMDKWLGTTMTIRDISDDELGFYKLREDTGERWDGVGWTWNEACFAGYDNNPFEAYWVRRNDREDTIGICWGHDRADLLIQWVCGQPKYIYDIGAGHNGNDKAIKDKCFNYTDRASEWVAPQYVTRIDEWEIIDKPDKAGFIRLNRAGGFSFNKPNSILYFDKTVDQTEKTASGENLLITAKHHYTLKQFTLDEPAFGPGWRYTSTEYQWVRPRGCGAHAEGKKSKPKTKIPDPKAASIKYFKPYWGYVKDYSSGITIKQDRIVYIYAEGGAWYEPPKTRELLAYLPIDSGHNGNDFIKIKPSEDVKIPEGKSWWFNQDRIIPIEFSVTPHRSPKVGDFIRILTPKYGQKGKILRIDECCGGNLVKVKAENHFDKIILDDKLYTIGDSCELLDIIAPVEIRTMVEIPKVESDDELKKSIDRALKLSKEYLGLKPDYIGCRSKIALFDEKCDSTAEVIEELKKSAVAPFKGRESDETITSPRQIIQAIIIYGPNAGTIISITWETYLANPNYYKPLL